MISCDPLTESKLTSNYTLIGKRVDALKLKDSSSIYFK